LSIPGGHAEGPASQHTSLKRDDGATLETCHSVVGHIANKCGHRAANTSRQEGGRPELWCVVLHMHLCGVGVAASVLTWWVM
jgi:hypothetical protein